MERHTSSLVILGRSISFHAGTDMARVREAAELVEKMYAEQKAKSRGYQSKDILLTFLALGLADELIQIRTKQAGLEDRIQSLLVKIEKSV